MSLQLPGRPADLALAALVLFASLAEVGMRESYHRVSAESVTLIVVGLLAVLCALLAVVAARAEPRALFGHRAVFIVAWCAALVASVGTHPVDAFARGGLSRAVVLGSGVAGVALLLLSLRVRPDTWIRLRVGLFSAYLLFILSPVALGMWRSEHLTWPADSQPAATGAEAEAVQPGVTMVLLLDELNATQAPMLAQELRAAGLQVNVKAVTSVGDSTGNVVPSLFAGTVFRDARPCGLTATCDARSAVDFSRIRASRDDIDVVGFFQPYCAIQGLRSCFRGTIPLAVFDTGRVQCGLWRRFGWSLGVDEESCRNIYIRSWGNMTDAVVAATRRAPALRQGGMLFAHLPLPHPPGEGPQGLLPDHYRANMVRATALLKDLLATARAAGLPTRVIIFSDHPLRQQQWCRSFAPYAWDGCAPDESLIDTQVPLIVAGDNPPDISGFSNNMAVFELILRLR